MVFLQLVIYIQSKLYIYILIFTKHWQKSPPPTFFSIFGTKLVPKVVLVTMILENWAEKLWIGLGTQVEYPMSLQDSSYPNIFYRLQLCQFSKYSHIQFHGVYGRSRHIIHTNILAITVTLLATEL